VSTADLQRLSAGSHPNLARTLFLTTEPVGAPAAFAALLSAILDAVRQTSERVEALERRVGALPAPEVAGHVLLVCRPSGYSVVTSEEPAPGPAATVELEDGRFVVARSTVSPFPGDRRRCVVLEPASHP
jgi:hypothetical protein